MNDIPVDVLWWQFYNPSRLWAIIAVPILLLAYLILLRLKRNKGMRYTQASIVGAVVPRQSGWRRHISVAMTLLCLIAIAGAWARPVGDDRVSRERATVVIVMDRSLSMQATDIEPNRLDAAKQAAKDFAAELPASYNVALVGMSASSSVLVAPTTDRQSFNTMVDSLELQEGTDIGAAILAALGAIAMAPLTDDDSPAPGMIVLLSDGENESATDSVESAVAEAKDEQVPIYTIAYGTQNGYVDLDGERYNVAPNLEVLAQIAQETGGEALDASSADQLQRAYTRLNSDIGYEIVHKEVTARWALYASLFAMVAALGAVSMAARWP